MLRGSAHALEGRAQIIRQSIEDISRQKDEIAGRLADIEKEHEDRYRKLIRNLKDGLVFSSDGDTVWECSNCGHIVIGRKAPEVCPVCKHPQSYFERRKNNY